MVPVFANGQRAKGFGAALRTTADQLIILFVGQSCDVEFGFFVNDDLNRDLFPFAGFLRPLL